MFKPAYLNLEELKDDSLEIIEEYVNGIDLDSFNLREIIKLCPILIDLVSIAYNERSIRDKSSTEYRIFTTVLALLSDSFNLLHSVKDELELTTPNLYSSTISCLTKLAKTIDIATKKQEEETQMDFSLSTEDLYSIGIKN